MIEKKCENCVLKESDKFYCCDCKYKKEFPEKQYNFFPKEEIVRKDEREKIIDALWLSITDDKKIIFEKDGHKFKLNLVPIINSEVE